MVGSLTDCGLDFTPKFDEVVALIRFNTKVKLSCIQGCVYSSRERKIDGNGFSLRGNVDGQDFGKLIAQDIDEVGMNGFALLNSNTGGDPPRRNIYDNLY